MSRALVASLVLLPGLALAQAGGGTASPSDVDALRKEFEAKLEAARREVKELRDELRAQQGTQPASQGWQEEWVGEKRKLELLTLDGYFRARPDLFYRMDLGRGLDPAGYSLWPRSPVSDVERTEVGVNMRFRLEPTINVSEEVRIKAQIDMLDNVVWGSTPGFGNGAYAGTDLNQFSLFNNTQVAPRSGLNSLSDSLLVKRVWGEVSTPIGILRFGRMGNHWGLGILYNDGNGIDSDYGDTVDRVSFTAEPIAGFYITPMIDFTISGPLSIAQASGGQPFDLTQSDNVMSYSLVVARRDTDQERQAKLEANQTVFNYGLHFQYRVQRNDSIDALNSTALGGSNPVSSSATWVQRLGNLYVPDLWAKVEQKTFRVEAEVAGIFGNITNRALSGATANAAGQNQSLYLYQVGAVLQGEYRFLNGDLEVGAEVGFASGDKAPGFGIYTRRQGPGTNGSTVQGSIDGPQYACAATCSDPDITNFRFNRDYRVDMILYRELLGTVTDSLYIKPKIKYRITQGFEAFASLLYSRAIFGESTPGFVSGRNDNDASLGLEINAGIRYETEDGFYGQLQYGILFPLAGLRKVDNLTNITLDNAQALRAVFGIRF